MSIFQNFQC